MTTRWKIWMAVGLLVLIGAALWKSKSPPEPTYQGRTFSEWFSDSRFNLYPANAGVAIKAMGKAAVPFLMHQFKLSTSRIHNGWVNLANRCLPRSQQLIPDDTRTVWAFTCLLNAGDQAEAAIPELVEMANDSSLSGNARIHIIALLGNIHKRPEKCVPVLAEALKSPDNNTRNAATSALDRFGPTARSAVPALLDLWRTTTRNHHKLWIGSTIQKIDPEAAAQAGIK